LLLERLQRRQGVRDLEKRFLIVCEDNKSAPNYFEALKKHFKLSATSIQVVGSDDHTQPIQVVERAVVLEHILDPDTFPGLVISDDYAVYANFTNTQKCWAHLLRKAIKLTLQEPNEAKYREFADRLLEIYRQACRVQKDKRFSAAGRQREVEDLEQDIMELCAPQWDLQSPPLPDGPANDYRLLVHEIVHVMLDNELFTFVTAPPVTKPNGQSEPVSGTNNEAERTQRPQAQARDTGRTNKTINGARRQTILVSVLESLRLYLLTYNLDSIINEIKGWWQAGQSCFTKLLRKMKLPHPTESILDKVLPAPDG